MADWWWIVLAIVVILAVAWLFMRSRSAAVGGDTTDASRNYTDERETSRLGGMSDEDREWEAASRERNRKSEEGKRTPPPPES